MVHIVGLENHYFQTLGAKTKIPAEILRDYVEGFLEDHNIDVIAEELTDDYCGIGCEEVVCESIADESNGEIGHRFVELNDDERAVLGISSEDHAAREAHWFDEIEDDLKNNLEILFVCGDAHSKSFQTLLHNKGYEATIVTVLDTPPNWEPGM